MRLYRSARQLFCEALLRLHFSAHEQRQQRLAAEIIAGDSNPDRAIPDLTLPRITQENERVSMGDTTSDAFLNWLFEKYNTDIIVGTHTGLHWHRETSPGKHFINCGAIGRPPNNGQTTVVYTIIKQKACPTSRSFERAVGAPSDGRLRTLASLKVDFVRLALRLRAPGLRDGFRGIA